MRNKGSRFSDIVTSEEEIRAILGPVYPGADTKVMDHLDRISADFIRHAPFCLVATGGGELNVEISPKGDPAGFVHVLDETTLAIPDRPGNNRIDTFRNVLANPKVGLIFLVPGRKDTLRLSGRALIVRDRDLRASMTFQGKMPEFAMVVHVDRAFFHCTKCMVRSGLWNPRGWPDTSDMTSFAAAFVKQARLKTPVDEVDKILGESEKAGLY